MSKTLQALTAAAALDGSEQTIVDQGGNPRRVLLGAPRANADALNLLDFIPQTEWAAIQGRTSTYDCLSAMNAAIAALPATGGKIVVPHGIYNFSGTIQIAKYVNLEGVGGGEDGGEATKFKFPLNTTGIHIGGTNGGANGSGSRLSGLCIIGSAVAGVSSTGDGVFSEFRCEIEECIVGVFGGNGVTIGASVPTANANNWNMRRCHLAFNNGDGLQVYGTDTNAGTGIDISGSANGGWGIADQSFLGNTFVGCHTEDNGSGAYHTNNENARSLFLGCYSEGGQPPSQILGPSIVIGGLHESGFSNDTSGQIMTSDLNTPIGIRSTVAASPRSFGYGHADSGIYLSADSGLTSHQICRWDATFNSWVIGYGNSSADIMLTATPGTGFIADADNGPNPVPAGCTIYNNTRWVYLGGQTAKQVTQTYASAAPVSGTARVGDIVFNTAPVAGGTIGWICTTAGTPGTWKTFGAIAA